MMIVIVVIVIVVLVIVITILRIEGRIRIVVMVRWVVRMMLSVGRVGIMPRFVVAMMQIGGILVHGDKFGWENTSQYGET